MTYEEALEVMRNEKACVERNIKGCTRQCMTCDLVLPDKIILEAYDVVIRLLSEAKK